MQDTEAAADRMDFPEQGASATWEQMYTDPERAAASAAEQEGPIARIPVRRQKLAV